MFHDFFTSGGFEEHAHGGHPGMRGQRGPQEEVDTDTLYELLKLEKNATQREVKRGWRKAAKIHHPDRGGDEETYKKCEQAYDILGDEEKRRLYDQGGLEAVKNGGHMPTNIFDLFSNGGRQSRPRVQKPAPIKKKITLDLEDVHEGPLKIVVVNVRSASEKVVCERCNGRGAVTETTRRGYMVFQTQRECPRCNGRGVSYKDERTIKKNLEVYVPRGVQNGDKEKLEGEGHDLPGMATGDVLIIWEVKTHPLWNRIQADLAIEREITLTEALCGYNFNIRSIVRGEWLSIRNEPGTTVQPNDVIKIQNQGLYQQGGGNNRGNVYIKFKVVLPTSGSLSENQRSDLSNLLSAVNYSMNAASTMNDTRVISAGDRVRLTGLVNHPQLNGMEGSVSEATNTKAGQYAVRLVNGQTVAVRAELLEHVEELEVDEDALNEQPQEDDFIEDCTGELIEDMETVKHTPAVHPSHNNYDSDEENAEGGIGCRQM